MKKLFTILMMLSASVAVLAADYYVSPAGSDDNAGTIDAPFATLKKAIGKATAGTTIYLREGTYQPTEAEIMGYQESNLYACVYNLTASGTAQKPITISGYEDEKAVIDLSLVKPAEKRVSGFYVKGNYWRLKKFDIIGIQVTITGHTQSENISMRGGSNCVIEQVNIHDGMGIGIYFTRGSNNLVLNCDAYNNYDSVSENGAGGNCDGFGFHFASAAHANNVIRGCRAWRNSDDGFDLINNYSAVVVDSCWAWENGYDANLVSRGDGTGIKGGGYGMSTITKSVTAPRNVIKNCIAWKNKQNGIYANHHLGGNDWYNNSAYANKRNYNMVNRKSVAEAVDVPGYDHVLKNNLSFAGTTSNYAYIDESLCTLENNTFLPTLVLTVSDFESLDGTQLKADRQPDGSLPEITFLKLKSTSKAYSQNIGYQFDYEAVASGIKTVGAGVNDDVFYSMEGYRVEHPAAKGIYVRGGKKFVK